MLSQLVESVNQTRKNFSLSVDPIAAAGSAHREIFSADSSELQLQKFSAVESQKFLCVNCGSTAGWISRFDSVARMRCASCERPPSQSFVKTLTKSLSVDVDLSTHELIATLPNPYIVAMGQPVCQKCKSRWVELRFLDPQFSYCGSCSRPIDHAIVDAIMFPRPVAS